MNFILNINVYDNNREGKFSSFRLVKSNERSEDSYINMMVFFRKIVHT